MRESRSREFERDVDKATAPPSVDRSVDSTAQPSTLQSAPPASRDAACAYAPERQELSSRRVALPVQALRPVRDVRVAEQVHDRRTAALQAAQGRGAVIKVYADGPLIVRGDFQVLDADGQDVSPGRSVIALCRCGRSRLKPLCDGSHQRAGASRREVANRFSVPPQPPECAPTKPSNS